MKELNVRWSLQSLEWLLEVIEEKGQEVEVGIEEDDQEVILDLEVEVEVGDIEVGQEVEKGGLEDTGIGPEVDLEIEDEDLDRKIAIQGGRTKMSPRLLFCRFSPQTQNFSSYLDACSFLRKK